MNNQSNRQQLRPDYTSLENSGNRLEEYINDIKVHDHLCLIYETQQEQLAAAIQFIAIGLKRGEKCIYIADDNTVVEVKQAFHDKKIDADSAIASGALEIITKQESYLKKGYFDPDEMIEYWGEALKKAKTAGFNILRTTGEMTSLLGDEKGVERRIEYEAKLNEVLPKVDMLVLCQYNRKRFSAEVIKDIIATHPLIVYGDLICKNPYYIPPREFLKMKEKATDLEVDRWLRNIQDLEWAEKMQFRLNRELRAISACNQVLMRASDETILLKDICRIICEKTGYRMVWVGYAEDDVAKTVRPVAWAGVEDGYLSKLNITWADTERGRGPTGTAIRLGELSYVQDFETDLRIAPWREEALKRGYHSSISFPLKSENAKLLGAISIYSSQSHAFTPDEVNLLQELANDLAYGIMALRNRVELKKAEHSLREKLGQLERDYKIMVGREKRVLELKKEVDELLKNAGKPPKYIT